MSIPEPTRHHAPTARRMRFIIGVVLIAVSFTVYLAYFIIALFLPFSAELKATAIVAASLISWGGFTLGIFLAGHEGYHLLKRVCMRRNKDESESRG